MELSSSSGVVAGVLALELSATSGKRNEKREFYVKLTNFFVILPSQLSFSLEPEAEGL